jgi:hypothetical protein
MAIRSNDGFATAKYIPLLAPDPPTTVTVVRSDSNIIVSFTAPTNVGGAAITSYFVESYISGVLTSVTASGASSPVGITGLTAGSTYTFTVRAVNKYGQSIKSAPSASILAVGSQPFTTAGTYSWIAPSGVTSVSVICVGGGGGGTNGGGTGSAYGRGGGGGELRYKNNITVIPGTSYAVVVGDVGIGGAASITSGTPVKNNGTSGGSSTFNSTTVRANGGTGGTSTTTYAPGGSGGTGDAGGNGGAGGTSNGFGGGGAGGAGGYSAAGGAAGYNGSTNNGTSATGGGGGGGGAANSASSNFSGPCCYQKDDWGNGGNGGGVGLYGAGSNGGGGTAGGSGGASGDSGTPGSSGSARLYGGGGFGGAYALDTQGSKYWYAGNNGGVGAVRVVWPASVATFPSTNVS